MLLLLLLLCCWGWWYGGRVGDGRFSWSSSSAVLVGVMIATTVAALRLSFVPWSVLWMTLYSRKNTSNAHETVCELFIFPVAHNGTGCDAACEGVG